MHRHDTRRADSRPFKKSSCYLLTGGNMNQLAMNCFAKSGVLAVIVLMLVAAATPALAQKSKDKKNQQPADSSADQKLPTSDSQAVEQTIGEALGYWQLGDVDSLHKYYADDVAVVSGLWEAPVMGWANYAKAYEAQRAAVTGGRMERSNTLIKVTGNSAWATYQFVYVSLVDGKVAQFRGHTTLVLNKQADRWLIVLNHSSIVDSSIGNSAVPAADPAPAAKP
jgi:ketosteroid isomerase-like protein